MNQAVLSDCYESGVSRAEQGIGPLDVRLPGVMHFRCIEENLSNRRCAWEPSRL